MKLSSKCLVVALSALFAAAPVLEAGAMPLPAVTVQPADAVQRVNDRDHGEYVDQLKWRRWPRRLKRDHGHDWSGERGDREGWYRGHRGYRYARPGYRRHDNGFWFPLAAFGAGAIIGGAIANDGDYGGGSTHVRWCANRYRSYRAYDNTFQPYGGPRQQCVSPYR